MAVFRVLVLCVIGFTLASCGSSKFKAYNGPAVTLVEVHKADRKMYLLHHKRVLRTYDIGLGFAPEGHKQFEGDGKTPEGSYQISHRNPDSSYHLSLGISYPNRNDLAFAEASGKSPGGEIFIHGEPAGVPNRLDWTAGCIAVSDKEIERIYAMVKPGTRINILP